MKFLSSFDTKFDEKLFDDLRNQYWDWNVFMIKRDRTFLIIPSFMFLFLILILFVLIIISYYQYWDKIFSYILIILYIVWLWWWSFTMLKLFILYFSSHNWHIHNISNDELNKEWEYEKFLRHTILAFIFQLLVLILSIFFIFFDGKQSTTASYLIMTLQLSLNVIFVYIMFKIFKKVLDFENDFTIVVPDKIEFINQSWIFTRTMRSLDSEKIKTISTDKRWLIRALLNIWSLIIFAEWDEWNSKWEIQLK